ncbi:MAG: Flp pilus assembly complex ATPase component TadA [Hydrogenophaga sp.]|uniref:GspE/PulE family protein n=1 Tax=Hydrogenophaga sp. TaxID=1904254 RepID=UPI0025C3FB18|nr:type II/IV secretion system protein [Hydrogenophaga sp.]MBT9550449.1 Flp pilus assembly complex ATPase component TadA [Hydrogenophaga sp.]
MTLTITPGSDSGSFCAAPRALVQTLPQLINAQDIQRRRPIVVLSEALRQLHLLDEGTLRELVAEDPDLLRSRSGDLVLRLLLTEDELHRALARVAGLVEIEVLGFEGDPKAFDLLPLRQAQALNVVPLGMANEQLYIASCAPTSDALRQQLRSLTGHSVALVWGSREAIERRLEVQERVERANHARHAPVVVDELWHKLAPPGAGSAQERVLVDDLVMQAMVELGSGAEAEQLASASESAGMVRLVNEMIAEAQRLHASDIHIETNPGEALTAIRFRRDGDLEPYLWLPAKLRGPLVSRVKIMARLDIAERRRPQDGKIDFAEFGGQALELRVAVMPTHDGLEDVVLRLLESAKPLPLSRLGLQPRDLETIAGFSQRSFGMVLAVGPTGSGKTTTLHSMLAEVNTAERKIWTAEDPIEITQPGLRQVQMNAKIGLTFASAMRSFLRADPDIIMIGEIRDAETAKIAIEASLTGHLVLSTLHTNNASESVVRLLDLGMDPMNFADSLLGLVAQRLVRALCPHCASTTALDDTSWTALLEEYREGSGLSLPQAQARLLDAAGVATPGEVRVRHAVGCEHCSGKGYKGRMGVYEILQNSREIKRLIQNRARPGEIFDTAVNEGMRSLRHDALEKVVQGRIDLKQARLAYR